MNKYKGTLISVEGLDGVGKSSTERLTKHDLRKNGQQIVLVHAPFVRYPNGKPYKKGQRMYKKIQSPHFKAQGQDASKLFAQNTKELEHQIVIPALKRGKTVIQDRYYGSTLAYQGNYVKRHGKYIDKNHTLKHLKQTLGKDMVQPDANIYLYLDNKDEVDRITGRAVGKTHKVDKYDRKVAHRGKDGKYHELDKMKKKYDIANNTMHKMGVPIKKINAKYQPEQRANQMRAIIQSIQQKKMIRDLSKQLNIMKKRHIHEHITKHPMPKNIHHMQNLRSHHNIHHLGVKQHQVASQKQSQKKQPTIHQSHNISR